MKKFPSTRATANEGVAFVFHVVSSADCIFRPVPQETDLGIDAYIEFVEREEATGFFFGAQIKAGRSYLKDYSDAQYFRILATKNDFRYWHVSPVPVALIAYDPESQLSGWLDITGHIRQFPEVLEKDNSFVTIHSRATPFTVDALKTRIRSTFEAYRSEAGLFDLAELVASQSPQDKLKGLSGLLQHKKSRFSRLTCYLLSQHLLHEDDNVRAFSADVLSRYLHHPEVSYGASKSLGAYVHSLLEPFGSEEVAELLATACLDEGNFMDRGSLGQSIGVIVSSIPDHGQHLLRIALSPQRDSMVRWSALALISELGLSEAIVTIVRDFDHIDWGEARDAAQWICDEYWDSQADRSASHSAV